MAMAIVKQWQSDPWADFLFPTFPRLHLLPHLVIDDRRAGRGLDHHAGHLLLLGVVEGQQRLPKNTKTQGADFWTVTLPCVLLFGGLLARRSKLWKIARGGASTGKQLTLEPKTGSPTSLLKDRNVKMAMGINIYACEIPLKSVWFDVKEIDMMSEQRGIWYVHL